MFVYLIRYESETKEEQASNFAISTCGGLRVGSSMLRSALISISSDQQIVSPQKPDKFWVSVLQKTARGTWQLELFLSLFCLHILPRITFLSGGIKFCHHGIKLSHCDTILESHIHNLWIYYGVCVCGEEKWEGSILHLFSPLWRAKLTPFYFFMHICHRKWKKPVLILHWKSCHSCRALRYAKPNTRRTT